MEIINVRNYSGRNIYSHSPVVKMTVDLGELANVPTKEITGFNERLLSLFPGLTSHYCSPGYEGGFVERLQEGTLISHVTEHLALELQCILGYEVYFGKTRVIQEPSKYCILFEYINEGCAQEFGYAAAQIISALAAHQPVDINEVLARLRQISWESDLGPSTKAIVHEAKRRQIPVRRLGENSLLQLGYGKHIRFIEASLPGSTSSIAVDLAQDKQLVKDLLREHNIPVPEGRMVNTEDAAVVAAEQLGYPIVIKPADSNHGNGVTTNINDESLLRRAYQLAISYSKRVLVEKYQRGKDYRILVVGDKVSAVAERRPPYVVGDGIHTILELVERENENPDRGIGHQKPLTKIELDTVAQDFLMRLGWNLQDIPKPGQMVYLRENSNLSTGGSARDCTQEIHPANKALAVKAAKILGLDVAGIDVVMDDISDQLTPQNGAFIEVNAAPGLRMHLFPSEGMGRNVAADILDYMYPAGTPTSIPVISITGTNGKTTVTRMIRHVLTINGKKVGMTCSHGTFIGEECISIGDNTGPVSAQSVLYNREVEVAVLETARGGIIKGGLGYDLADVGVITNISEDHLGLDGINTLKDLAFVKSLVVEAVKPDGYAVLNADDKMTEYIIPRVKCHLAFFSQDSNNQLIRKHIKMGGLAVVAENNQICWYNNHSKSILMEIDEIPITFGGQAFCNIENALAAITSLLSLGVAESVIRWGLMSFKPDYQTNAGRFNIFDLGDYKVLLDYGHNFSGYKSVIQFAQTQNASRLVGIIGMPGDRSNEAIYEVGRLSGQNFQQIYIKEDGDLRNRAPGETAGLLYEGALAGGLTKENIMIIPSETEALKTALENAYPGDLIVMFFEKFDPVLELVQYYMNKPVQLVGLFPLEEKSVPDLPYLHA